MNNEKEHKPNKRSAVSRGSNVQEFAISTVAGLVSGVVAAGAAIRKEFNDEIKNMPGIATYELSGEAAQAEKNLGMKVISEVDGVTKFKGLFAEHQEALLAHDVEQFNSQRSWIKSAEIKAASKAAFAKDKADFLLRVMKIHTTGIKGFTVGTYQRLINIGRGDRGIIAFTGLSTAAVVGVGMYNLLTSIATRAKTREIEDLILDKVLENPASTVPAETHIPLTKPEHAVTQVASHERLSVANGAEMNMRA